MMNNSYGHRGRKVFFLLMIGAGIGFFAWKGRGVIERLSFLQENTSSLHSLGIYDQQVNSRSRSLALHTIADIESAVQKLQEEQNKADEHLKTLQEPYQKFLRFLLFPSLNIRKNPFTHHIDATIIGTSFLEKNIFLDSNRLSYRTTFFRGDGANQITHISVSDLVEEDPFVRYTVTVDFSAPTKQAFFLLISKLGVTSDAKQIALLHEFLYYLQQVKKEAFSIPLEISEIELDLVIRAMAKCSEAESREECLLIFKHKVTPLSFFSSVVASPTNTQRATDLISFFATLPPLTHINQFTFAQNKNVNIGEGSSYAGTIVFDVYGQAMSSEEIDEIAKVLASKCGYDNFSPEMVIQEVDTHLQTQSFYPQLRETLQKITADYNTSSVYKKTIILFELSRMLHEYDLCKPSSLPSDE